MARGGMNFEVIFGNPVILVTVLLSSAAWWIAFIGQILVEAKCELEL